MPKMKLINFDTYRNSIVLFENTGETISVSAHFKFFEGSESYIQGFIDNEQVIHFKSNNPGPAISIYRFMPKDITKLIISSENRTHGMVTLYTSEI
ncbi:hypothetical protein VSY18_29320 (plasmid) [Bacillus albus]|uniref:Uncharacterized protein n=1 Tax=Bacillus wiedmannii TaxID=1890302 RepID=A0A2C5PV21_9BACI|nr:MULTISPECIES: hypothetical protein [Bacillus cereus group]MBU5219721.1 hypothetical protein [Bacillus albus]MDA2029810.1 hypothetical protein [Bacillus cereus group sp. Bcc03]MDA2219048.1 hypothetical protein [Bacillus cereus group sp. Bc228]MDA2230596.1 hypothetical protein [Bacillus cereus group sp. Bc227]MDA2263143.1 hypothetical protein [Bacillus cereus group sp. Bc200]